MKNFSFLLLFFSISLFGQNLYDKGYYVDNSGTKHFVLINNLEWQINPKFIEYKISNDSSVESKKIEEVKEFGIEGGDVFKRYEVKVETSIDNLQFMDYNASPKFITKTVFLRQVTFGKLNLLVYHENEDKFYYSKSESDIPEPLIYKRYLTNYDAISKNEQYKEQLKKNFNCADYNYENLNYNLKSLKQFAEYYNADCKKPVTEKRDRTLRFAFTPKVGVLMKSFTASREGVFYAENIKMGSKALLKFGADLEINLARNQTLTFILSPMYQSYENQKVKEYDTYPHNQDFKVNFQSVELGVGLRYYQKINKNFSVTYTGQAVPSLNIGSDFYYNNYKEDLSSNNIYVSFGVGFKYKRFFSDIRFDSRMHQIYKGGSSGDYSGFGLFLGYQLNKF
jgi:hypothetical protein